ncbi:LpxI family protein [Candidatus Poribacteria bacterium]|nr:UDP-2,3-diacylglucosamine diphosphatase LpxI [Candidatus Poribacteria bacterium]MYH81636.1 LpxI family protein [Candidatus Poribacteria bacterium]
MEKLGIIAGAGKLPVLLARAAVAHDREPVIIQITKSDVQRFAGIAHEIHTYGVGQIQKIARTLLNAGVQEVVIIGKVEKNILLLPFQIDTTTIKILVQNRREKPAVIVNAALNYLESAGLTILTQDRYLQDLLPQPGVLTKRPPTASQQADIELGITTARQIANMDIGQTVVVKNQIVLAIEAIEGTDATIKRGGNLGRKGVVVVKASAENHDFRIDVPTVGMQTLEVLHQANAGVLAVEARRTFVMDADVLIQQADRWKIAIVAVE